MIWLSKLPTRATLRPKYLTAPPTSARQLKPAISTGRTVKLQHYPILQLDAALDRINPPRTLSSNWVLRLGSHQGGRKRHKQKV